MPDRTTFAVYEIKFRYGAVYLVCATSIDPAIETALAAANEDRERILRDGRERTREEIQSVNMLHGLVLVSEEVNSVNANVQ